MTTNRFIRLLLVVLFVVVVYFGLLNDVTAKYLFMQIQIAITAGTKVTFGGLIGYSLGLLFYPHKIDWSISWTNAGIGAYARILTILLSIWLVVDYA
jgi:hypothetical protein